MSKKSGHVVRRLFETQRTRDVGGVPVPPLLESNDLLGLRKSPQDLSQRSLDRGCAAMKQDQRYATSPVNLVVQFQAIHVGVGALGVLVPLISLV